MSYEKEYGHLAFFVPNVPLAVTTAGVSKEIDIGAASADHGEYVCIKNCTVKRLGFVVTGEAAGGTSVAPQVIFTKRPTPLSASSEVVVENLVIPDGTAIGSVLYLDFLPVEFAVGDSVEISHVVGTGTPTGKGHAFFLCLDCPEVAGNNTDMIASA